MGSQQHSKKSTRATRRETHTAHTQHTKIKPQVQRSSEGCQEDQHRQLHPFVTASSPSEVLISLSYGGGTGGIPYLELLEQLPAGGGGGGSKSAPLHSHLLLLLFSSSFFHFCNFRLICLGSCISSLSVFILQISFWNSCNYCFLEGDGAALTGLDFSTLVVAPSCGASLQLELVSRRAHHALLPVLSLARAACSSSETDGATSLRLASMPSSQNLVSS